MTHTHTHTRTRTFARTSLDVGSVRRRGIYLHNTHHSQQTFIPLGRFQPTISASDQPQTHALQSVGTGISK